MYAVLAFSLILFSLQLSYGHWSVLQLPHSLSDVTRPSRSLQKNSTESPTFPLVHTEVRNGLLSTPEPTSGSNPNGPVFRDVTLRSGISVEKRLKYGGPIIADLDSDGYYDLILTYHGDAPLEVYYGSKRGRFTKSSFSIRGDLHGVSVAPRTATSPDKVIVVSIGGSNGSNPKLPKYFLSSGRNISPIFKQLKINSRDAAKSRGRISMFMDLTMDSIPERQQRLGGPDLLIASFLGKSKKKGRRPRQYALQNTQGNISFRKVPGFEDEVQGRAELTDIDGDGKMEIISYQEFRIYKIVAPFQFNDVTAQVAPGIVIPDYTVMAVVEFDMDNDGDFDLYIARGFEKLASNTAPKKKRTDFPDMLLENRNGIYYDVTEGSNIVGNTFSSGVSAEDLNNDGYVDLIVSQSRDRDIVLLNRGDGTFGHFDPGIPKPIGSRTENTLAVDIDGDGRVDLVSAHGLRMASKGLYVIMKNLMPHTPQTHYLTVRVGSAPSKACTALHAVVTVLVNGEKMVRRVGSRGAQKAGPGSYFDIVHFGLGSFSLVQKVTVAWITGEQQSKRKVKVNKRITFGSF